jgi:signal transduction histidine kinase
MKPLVLPRRAAAGLLLLAAAAVVVLIGAQTLLALQSQQRLAHRVLSDHAATALWYFEQNLERDLSTTVECVFHDALHTTSGAGGSYTLRTGVPHPAAPPTQSLLDLWFPDAQCGDVALDRPATVFRFGPGSAIESAGEPAPDRFVAELRALVEAAVRERPPLRRSDGTAAGVVAGVPRLVLYSQQQIPGGEAVYAVPLDPRSVAAIVMRATRGFRLLPPPVLPDSARASVMRLSLGLPGQPLYRTSAAGPAVAVATRELQPALGGLLATAEVTPVGAAVLAQPPMHAARLPGLLALLLLSLGLVLLAYRQLRREQELATLRGDFVASVSHELRTPLSLQRIFLDTIRLGRAETPDRMDWAIQNIDRESRRLEHLVSNILHFARSERGQLDLEPRRAELVAAVRHAAAAFRPLAEQRDADISVIGDPPVEVDLDEPAFHRALGNVLENAIKYGPQGQRIAVRVTVAGRWATVEVDDQGRGLPADEREKVLEPFRRGRDTRGGAIAGSGIGLAVVSEVLTLHGGRVSLDSTPDGGLRVRLILPLLPSPGGSPAPDAPPDAARSGVTTSR